MSEQPGVEEPDGEKVRFEEPSVDSPGLGQPSIFRARHYGCLWWVVGTAVLLQVFLVIGLLITRQLVAGPLKATDDGIVASLATINGDLEPYRPYSLNVRLDEPLTVYKADDIRFVRTLTVPVAQVVVISDTVPFNDTVQVPIRTSIAVNDTISLPITLLGLTFVIDLPVALNLPVNLDVEAPISTNVPLKLEVPMAFTLDAPVDVLVPLRNQYNEPWTMQLDLNTQVPVPMDDMIRDLKMDKMLAAFHELLMALEKLMLVGG